MIQQLKTIIHTRSNKGINVTDFTAMLPFPVICPILIRLVIIHDSRREETKLLW